MAKKSQDAMRQERELLLTLIERSATPLELGDISKAYASQMGHPLAYATLRARLAELLASGLLERDQRRRSPRYWATEVARSTIPGEIGHDAEHESAIPLSADARRARTLLARHASHRAPSTYAFAFLDDYTPNTSAYLPAALRSRLATLGRTAAEGQPAGTYARDIMQRLVIDLSWGSSRLEGNKYTRIDTEELIRSGRDAEGASDVDRQMILNHKAAIEYLVESADTIDFNRYTMQNLHALLAENLLDDRTQEGQLRQKAVTIGTSLYTPTALPQVVEERFDTLLQKAAAIADPIEQAFFSMVHIPYLQPFIDVNKRTSRLGANIPLIKNNLCPLLFVDVPEGLHTQGTLAIYELRDVSLLRDVFVWAYERSCQQFRVLRHAVGEPDPIRLNYRLQLREVVRRIVLELQWPDANALLALADAQNVPPADRTAFANEASQDLTGLRPEVLARYALRLSDFERWRDTVASKREATR
jgi:Fic family protein